MSNQDQTTATQGTGPIDESLRTNDTLFDAACAIPEISSFVEKIRAAGMEPVLKTEGFRTLFAPSNDAAGSGQIDVARHIVEGGQIEADLRTVSELQTVAGSKVRVEWRPDGAVVGGAKILRRDLACRNGFIHVIDKPVQ